MTWTSRYALVVALVAIVLAGALGALVAGVWRPSVQTSQTSTPQLSTLTNTSTPQHPAGVSTSSSRPPARTSSPPPATQPVVQGFARTFRSYEELVNVVKESLSSSRFSLAADTLTSLGFVTPIVTVTPTATVPAPKTVATPLILSSKQSVEGVAAEYGVGRAPAFSKTNVQVAGVDEADIVKTDGKYIYVARGNEVVVVKAYPPSSLGVECRIKFNGSVRGLFIAGNRLVVIVMPLPIMPLAIAETTAGEVTVIKTVTITRTVTAPGTTTTTATTPSSTTTVRISLPVTPWRPPSFNTTVYVYDVSSVGSPKLVLNVSVSGQYVTSRMIGDYVYVIASMPIKLVKDYVPLPTINGAPVSPSRIAFLGPDVRYTFTTVLAINVRDLKYLDNVFMVGSSAWVYVSTSNMYILSPRWAEFRDVFTEVVKASLPKLPGDVRARVEEVLNSSAPWSVKVRRAADIVADWFNRLSREERLKVLREYTKTVNDVIRGLSLDETVIYRFSLRGLNVTAEAKGAVPGMVLDQFSMDEYGGYFRVATTSRNYVVEDSGWVRAKRFNNVYVLDMNLTVVGRLEGLAPGERVYAARYLGDLMYLVTYRSIDPLFGIDLSNPREPKVIGFLKIPGYSEYLHPYRDRYLIGVGYSGGSGFRGCVKVSLFDISDPSNITEVSKVVLKDYHCSPLFRDHKAFLINPEKGYIAFPVACGRAVDGVAVVEVGDGFLRLKGVVPLPGGVRELYIGDYMYAVSHVAIKVVSDKDLGEVAQISLTTR